MNEYYPLLLVDKDGPDWTCRQTAWFRSGNLAGPLLKTVRDTRREARLLVDRNGEALVLTGKTEEIPRGLWKTILHIGSGESGKTDEDAIREARRNIATIEDGWFADEGSPT